MADEPQADAPMTARERRRSRAATASKPKGGNSVWKQYKVHVIILLLFGGLATAMAVNASQTQDCPGHWHSTMDVYVNGERVSFAHPKYTLEGSQGTNAQGSMSLRIHMHSGADYMWHWEPPAGAECIEFRESLELIDMTLSKDRITLTGAHEGLGQGGTFQANDTHKLSVWHRVGDGDWEKTSVGAVMGRQQHPDERLLIVYGNETEDGLAPFQAKADGNPLTGSTGGQGRASYVPVVGVSIMGLVALGVWHSLSRKM